MKNNFIYLFLIVFLSSCGGGGGSPSNASPSASVTLSSNSYSILIGSEITLNWSSLNTSSCSASGAWTGNKPISGNEVITISIPGNNIFTLTCTGSSGSSSSTIEIEGYREINGVTVDGYIRSSDIFIDENNNYVIDANENTDISNNSGQFTIKYSNGNLISLGGFDLDTGNLLSNFEYSFNSSTAKLTKQLSLNSGINSIQISAKNSFGEDQDQKIIIYNPNIISPPPNVIITTPSQNPHVSSSSTYRVNARVLNIESSNQIQVLFNNVEVNNFTYLPAQNQLEFDAFLVDGSNKVFIKAVNSYGRSSDETTIEYLSPQLQTPPIISFIYMYFVIFFVLYFPVYYHHIF